MAEIKYKFDYIEPENVLSQVPGEQELREGPDDATIEKSTVWDEDKIENKDEYVLAPVVTITKNEATFTKGDMKLQKVSVTENVSEIRNGVFTTIKPQNYPPIYSDVIRVTPIRTMDHTSQSEARNPSSRPIRSLSTQSSQSDPRNQSSRRMRSSETQSKESEERKTRIPTKFRDTVNRVRREKSVPAKKVNETQATHPRRSSIPRLKPKAPSPKPEDEFEKLYGEIADNSTDIDISLLNNKVEDPDKVEDCFEEIIHAYDEHKIQPITVEAIKHDDDKVNATEKPKSKIPMLKRKSEAEIEVPKTIQANNKTSPSTDKHKVNDAVAKVAKSESNETKLPSIIAATKSVNVERDNTKLNATYKRIKSISQDGQKQEIQVENIVKVSLEQDIRPDNVINVDDLGTSKAIESTVKIIEITPVAEAAYSTYEETIQPYVVEIVESPTSITVEELQNGVIEIEDTTERESIIQRNKVDSPEIENKPPLEPIKVVSMEDFLNIKPVKPKEFENLRPVMDANTNGASVQNIDEPTDESYFARNKFSEKTEFINSGPKSMENINKGNGTDDIKSELIKRESNNEASEEEVVKHKSVLSKIAMFEQKQDHKTNGINPKPAVRCSYRRKLIEKEVFEHERNTHSPENRTEPNNNNINSTNPDLPPNPEISKELENNEFKPKVLTSSIPVPQIRHTVTDSKPIIVSEIIKPIEAKSDSNNMNSEMQNPVKDEEFNNVAKSENLRISKMEIKTEEVSVSKAFETNIIENETEVESKEDVAAFDNTNNERKKRHHPNRYYSFEVDLRENPVSIEKAKDIEVKLLKPVEIEYAEPINNKIEPKTTVNDLKSKNSAINSQTFEKPKLSIRRDPKESPFDFTPKTNDFNRLHYKITPTMSTEEILNTYKAKNEDYNIRKAKSIAELDLGDAVKGKVHNIIVRMKSVDKSVEKKQVISVKERPRKKSVSEKIALFEGVFTQATGRYVHNNALREDQRHADTQAKSEEEYQRLLEELDSARRTYGQTAIMPTVTLNNGVEMPVMAIGTALLDPRLATDIVATAIDLGYRAIDTAYIYGNEKAVGEGIKKKIEDGTVKRSDLFIISKLWSTFHRRDLVEKAYRQSLESLGLEYIDLYLIHNPMSFKEGNDPIPMIAKVIQYSEHDYLDAWYGMEDLVAEGLVKSIGLSNFNASQVQKILDKARVKPVVNQVECHPYLSQQRLYNFCDERNIKLSCYGVLGSKGTPPEHKNTTLAAIDDPLVQAMAAGLNVTPAQLLIRYQLQSDHAVVVKASTGAHLWDNLRALGVELSEAQMTALRALNRNKRTFVFKGMGDTHKNYPFHAAF